MKCITSTLIQLILLLFFFLFFAAPVHAAEIDDSTVFVAAFNAYQQKDYLLALEKCEQLNQVFPNSPLRDVTLLLIARASLKSGDLERAAKFTSLFSTEFPESSLKASIEDELTQLVSRHQKGEVLTADSTLQTAARKISSDRLARERAAELIIVMERSAKAKIDQENQARIKREKEQLENERLQAEKRAKTGITATISVNRGAGPYLVPVGTIGSIPIEVTNSGKSSEDFLLTVTAPNEYNAILSGSNKPDERVTRLKLASGETFRGAVVFIMPTEMVDGYRTVFSITAVSAKFNDVRFKKEAVIIGSAPLVRAVAKLVKQKVTPGEELHYRVTVLNAGSLSARQLSVRLKLPPQVDFQDAPDVSFKQELNGTLVFNMDQVETGKLSEILMNVKVREDSIVGQELRGHVEVVNNSLHRKDTFIGAASFVQAK